jgi:hypothetical protein
VAGPMAPLLSIFSAGDPGGSERDDAVQLSTTLPNWVPFEVTWVMVCAGRTQIRPPHTGYFCREDENGLERTTGKMCESSSWDFSDLKAIFLNCTLKRSGELSHTEGLIQISKQIMEKNGIATELLRHVDPAGREDLGRHAGDRETLLDLGRPGERLHESQHHIHDMEHHAHGKDAERRRWDSCPRRPAL